METQYNWTMPSPVGDLELTGDGKALSEIRFLSAPGADGPRSPGQKAQAPFGEVISQLEQYFAGERTEFDLPLAPVGTQFQLAVWQLLIRIPYGHTRSYGDLAKLLGKPGASRAVGAVNGANPLPIVVPCHRVIGASGKLTGFGGGLHNKEILLRLEGSII